jgi:hypothetical protein
VLELHLRLGLKGRIRVRVRVREELIYYYIKKTLGTLIWG